MIAPSRGAAYRRFYLYSALSVAVIALAVALEGDQPGVEFAGAEYAAPVAREIIAEYFERRAKGK